MYDREVFQDVGRAYLISLLDITCTNPLTRLGQDNPQQAIEKIRSDVKRDSERDSIKKMKLKSKKLLTKKKAKVEVEF